MHIIKSLIKHFCEREYIVTTLFNVFIKTTAEIQITINSRNYEIQLPNNKTLTIEDHFFKKYPDDLRYLQEEILPSNVDFIQNQFTPEKNIPMLYGRDCFFENQNEFICGNDIFGTCFLFLTRLEEYIIDARDSHGRFPATASIAYKYEFLDRPIVDEYVEYLWNMMTYLDPSLTREKRIGKIVVTCDLDWPFHPASRSFVKTVMKMGSLLFKKDLKRVLQFGMVYIRNRVGCYYPDEYRRNISWMMDVNEQAGNRVHFYFITHYTSPLDSNINFESNELRALLHEIHNRGHYIGLHPGYNTISNADSFDLSAEKLKRILKTENITQDELGGRQHYLRWDMKTTPQLWERNGLTYDSTLSFADKAGFRCGTSREYPLFDVINRKTLNISERPLIIMESTIFSDRYEGLGYTKESLCRFQYFKEKSIQYGGNFVLLWHNSHFENINDKLFYRNLITQTSK